MKKILSLLLVASLGLSACKTSLSLSSKVGTNQALSSDVAMDTAMTNYYEPYKEELEKRMNHQIGTAAQPLIRSGREPETLVGNFFAETLLSIGRQFDPSTQIAIGTKGGIRTDINKGPITIETIFEFMPFENFIVVMEISGDDLYQLCQFIAKTGGQPVAGLRLKIKDGQPQDIEIDGQPFDRNKTYKIATYDFLANGGDLILGLSSPIKRQDTDIRVREAIISYIEEQTKENKQINAKLDGRVTIIK